MGWLIEAVDWLNVDLLLVLVMGIAVWGLVREWWVTGPRYRAMEKDRDYWREKFFESAGLGDELAKIALEEAQR